MALRHFVIRAILLLLRIPLKVLFYYPKVFSARLDRARGKNSGIVEVIDGQLTHPTGVYAIFVLWQPRYLPWYVINALQALAKAGANVLLVANHALSPEQRSTLSPLCMRMIIRDNSGFDIGGYRDATLYAAEHFDVQRMLYLNDSIYYFERGLDAFMSRLATSPADICAAFENWERHYHLQSFALSVSGRLFRNPKFIGFWRDYLPVSSRLWAINRGEVGLSRAMVQLAESIDVIYRPNDLLAPLRALPDNDLQSLMRYLPATSRSASDTRQRLSGEGLIEHLLVVKVPVRSQIHTAGFLAHRFLQCPIIKRDLVYRLQYTVYDVENCLRGAGTTEHLDDLLTDMRRKGMGSQLPLLRRLQFGVGLV